MAVDDVARRATKNHASRLREAETLIGLLGKRIEALEASYDASQAILVRLEQRLLAGL